MRIRTYSGRLVDPIRPVKEDVEPYSMIHALSQINRFTGHSVYPYSVAQHSLILTKYVRRRGLSIGAQRAALVHDLAEAWFNDLATPVKCELESYKHHMRKAELVINNTLGVSRDDLAAIKVYDHRMYINERDALCNVVEPDAAEEMWSDRLRLHLDPCEFNEMYWRDVRTAMWHEFQRLFPEWEGTA